MGMAMDELRHLTRDGRTTTAERRMVAQLNGLTREAVSTMPGTQDEGQPEVLDDTLAMYDAELSASDSD